MISKPTVAVCIPTFNQSRYLIESVKSACAQTYPGVEVWVSDDASTDNSAEVLQTLALQYSQLRYYVQPVNLNIAANNTWLLAQPSTDFVIRLDSDDIMEPRYVETLLPLMLENARAGYAHSAVQVIDEEGRFLAVTRLARATGFRSAEQALRDSVCGYRVAANIVMFRSACLRELDYYRDRPDFVEDYDLSVRMSDAGYGNVYSDEILARYRVWTDSKRARSKRKGMQLKGYVRIFDEALAPAFSRRGWSSTPLRRERLRLAAHHAPECYAEQYSLAERKELIALLWQLAGRRSLALRTRLVALKLGFRPLFERELAYRKALKRVIKAAISRSRPLFSRARVKDRIARGD